jgi:hypothetical protein
MGISSLASAAPLRATEARVARLFGRGKSGEGSSGLLRCAIGNEGAKKPRTVPGLLSL